MACDLRSAAGVLAAMGNPVRLELLRRMLLGATTVGQIQEIDGVGTASQVQHHMRELRAGGLVVSRQRNHYAIPTDRVVPVLLVVGLALGRRLSGSAGPDPVADKEPTPRTADEDASDAEPAATKYWVLHHLARKTGPSYTRGEVSGSLAFGGVAQMGPGRVVDLTRSGEFTVPDVMACDLPSAAVVLAALGHPVRLELLRRMLLGATTVGELQQVHGIGSTGQVHHHLRELRAARYVASAKRNQYAVLGDRIVHLLVILAASEGRRVFAAAGREPSVDDR
jgi:DNA-binding transcriptional ArsR family regulator